MNIITSEKSLNAYNGSPESMYIIDILGTIIIQQTYGNYNNNKKNFFKEVIPKSNESRVRLTSSLYMSNNLLEFYDTIKNKTDEIVNSFYYSGDVIGQKYNLKNKTVNKCFRKPVEINIWDSFIRNNLPVYRNNHSKYPKYNLKHREKIFDILSSNKIPIVYPVVYWNYNKFQKYNFINKSYVSRLFTLKKDIIKKDKKGRIVDILYKIKFDTILGILFTQNVLSGNMFLLPGRFYSMKNKTQRLYRSLILRFYKNKKTGINPKIPLNIIEVKKLLKYNSDNYESLQNIKKLFEELIDNNFIENLKISKNKRKDYIFSFDKIKIFK